MTIVYKYRQAECIAPLMKLQQSRFQIAPASIQTENLRSCMQICQIFIELQTPADKDETIESMLSGFGETFFEFAGVSVSVVQEK